MADREKMRELGRRGGKAKAAMMRGTVAPYPGTFLDFREAVDRGGPTRRVWTVAWKAADGLPLDADELPIYQLHAGRLVPPTKPASAVWIPAGRRSGKSEQMVTRATWRAIGFDWRAILQAGEVGTIPIIAAGRDQAHNTLGYLKGLADHPLVKPFVRRVLRDAVEFRTGAVVRVATASYRFSRGFSYIDAVLEECAFFASDDSANPDEEIVRAILPGLLTVPGARLYGISSPYARRGVLWKAYEKHWGREDSDVLVFCADTQSLNPTVSSEAIAQARIDDPQSAGSEFGADGLVTFRSDVSRLFDPETIAACVMSGVHEIPRTAGTHYFAFGDAAGGSGSDSFTLAVAHNADGQAVVDCVREWRPKFSPEAVVEEASQLLKSYGVSAMTMDNFSGDWVKERLEVHGIGYSRSTKTRSELYRECLPRLNAGRVALLDNPRLLAQLESLERRVARGGRELIDAPPGCHEDVANSVAGVVYLASVAAHGASASDACGSVWRDANDGFHQPRESMDEVPQSSVWRRWS